LSHERGEHGLKVDLRTPTHRRRIGLRVKAGGETGAALCGIHLLFKAAAVVARDQCADLNRLHIMALPGEAVREAQQRTHAEFTWLRSAGTPTGYPLHRETCQWLHDHGLRGCQESQRDHGAALNRLLKSYESIRTESFEWSPKTAPTLVHLPAECDSCFPVQQIALRE
jgi:hypothetical protein